MNVPYALKKKIYSMVSHHKKASELQDDVEGEIIKLLNLSDRDELESLGITDQIVDSNINSFDVEALIKFLEENV